MTSLDPPGLICLGASAGGLRSIEAVVSRLPADLPWPVLISQHMQADRVSQLPEILTRFSSLPVIEAVAGDEARPGHIYTTPSSGELGIAPDGRITLRDPVPGKPQRIDHLFSTAALARPGRVIAVVLSGTGSDGAVGTLVVKLNGGTVIVESDASAQHVGMPAAAVRAGTVDVSLAADQIARLVVDLAGGGMDDASAMTRVIIGDIADHITRVTGTDFARYRLGTLRRRAEKRRAIVGEASLANYRDRIMRDPVERDAFVRSLLVPVTEFFRDPPVWKALADQVFPDLAERAATGAPVRIWCAGCASGEEAYSLAILVAETIAHPANVKILATDLAQDALDTAIAGAYDVTRMAGVDAQRRERYFRATEHGYIVSDALRRMIDFQTHDVTGDPPSGRFDLIVCRNLLIYFEDDLQARTLARLRRSLEPDGILLLGRSEAVPRTSDAFEPLAKGMRIFRAQGPAPAEGSEGLRSAGGAVARAVGAPAPRVEDIDAMVLALDGSFHITSANARAKTLMERDVVGQRLLDVFPSWQGSPVHDALLASARGRRGLKVRNVPTPWGRVDVRLDILPGAERGALLVATPAGPTRVVGTPWGDVREVEEDLATTNEELQAANEELAATNEELQAANEELASLNEEFQSTNQNLATTNAELQNTAIAGQPASALLAELFETRREAIIACDPSRHLTMFNRRAGQLFGLDRSSVGQPLSRAMLGPGARELDAWLAQASPRLGPRAFEHEGQRFDLVIDRLSTQTGLPLGWVLTWAEPRDAKGE